MTKGKPKRDGSGKGTRNNKNIDKCLKGGVGYSHGNKRNLGGRKK